MCNTYFRSPDWASYVVRCVRCSVSNAEALIILTHGLCVQLELTLGSVQVLYKHVRGGGLKEMLILLMWLGGGSRGKMIKWHQRIKILIHLKMAFKSVKYHFTLWSKAIYEKICHIYILELLDILDQGMELCV